MLSQADKSNVFTYISNKIGKKKETLLRHCRNKMQQQQQSVSSQQSSSATTTTTASTTTTTTTNTPTRPNAANYQRLQNSQTAVVSPALNSSMSSSSKPVEASLTLGEVSEPLRNKLVFLESSFQQFKAKNERAENFFALPKISQLIHSVDSLTKLTANNSQNRMAQQTRRFTLEFLCSSFGVTRDTLLKRLSLIKRQHLSAQVTNKTAQLKKAVEEEMPKQLPKYKQMCDDYLRQRAAASADPGADKKLSAPRKSSSSLVVPLYRDTPRQFLAHIISTL